MVMSVTPIVCITLAFWLGRSGLIASVGCCANAWPAHPAPNRITKWKSESRLVQIMVVLLGCRISCALCNAAARSSKQGDEVSTGALGDRVRLERNRPGCRVISQTSDCKRGRLRSSRTAPRTSVTPTLVLHLTGFELGKKL